MRTIEIKNRYNGDVIFSHTCDENTIKKTVEKAAEDGVSLIEADLSGVDLREANLYKSNLSGANLRKADLRGTNLLKANLYRADLSKADLSEADLYKSNLLKADLRGVDLSGSDLRGVDLREANLREADLSGAYLSEANLSRAVLRKADLSEADLYRADLSKADLSGVNLEDANLKLIKEDFYKILERARPEIEGLKLALINGEIDGSVYEGECCCLIGTIAKCRGVHFEEMDNIMANSSRPAETWFMGIKSGDTPNNNPVSKITLDWINEFQNN